MPNFPTGVILNQLEIGPVSDFYGDLATLNVSVTPVLKGGVKHITHTSSGQTLVASTKQILSDGVTGVATVTLPTTDQAGWQDPSGKAIDVSTTPGWHYTIKVSATVGRTIVGEWTKTLQPLQSQTAPIDVDLVGSGQILEGVLAPSAVVTSLAGLTGAITAAEVESVLTGKANAAYVHEHEMRVSELRRRTGRVSVEKKAAVTIVMDHGLNKFDASIRALLTARNIPVTLALNSQKWADAQNNLVTQATVTSWIDAGWLEAANHGRTHTGYATDAENTTEIEGGRSELETQLGRPVDSWVQSGPFAANGFDAGNAPSKYWSTHAGREILRAHAVVTGTIPGDALYPLDGEPTVGMKGGWIDTGTTDVEAAITSAINSGTGYIVRFHPQYLDQTGYLTTTQLTAFLDKLVAQRNAGDIELLTLRKFALAEKNHAAVVDTGVKTLALPAGTAWTSVAAITVQRHGKTVTLSIRDAKQTTLTGNQTIITLPAGYRPAVNMYQDSYQGTRTFITTAGAVTFVGPLEQEFLSVTFLTQDAPPA